MTLRLISLMIMMSAGNCLFGQMYLEKHLSNDLEGRRSPSEESFDRYGDIRDEMHRQHKEDCDRDCEDDD